MRAFGEDRDERGATARKAGHGVHQTLVDLHRDPGAAQQAVDEVDLGPRSDGRWAHTRWRP